MRFIVAAPPAHASAGRDAYMEARAFPTSETAKIEYEGCGAANSRDPLPGSHLPIDF